MGKLDRNDNKNDKNEGKYVIKKLDGDDNKNDKKKYVMKGRW